MSIQEITFDKDLTRDTFQILEKYTNQIPEHYFGIDRVIFLDSLFKKISIEETFVLNDYVNQLLKIMVTKEASDLELGGFGSEGYVWLRIYGSKNRVEQLPQLSFDQTALLILSIINEKQRTLLFSNRNLDFSYTFDYYKRNISGNKKHSEKY